ncbi:ATP-binding cassette domain-containing protein [Pseudodesulfovibrio sp. F-1]|uniref:ATP-binding cassette domain-containing protein n=1 Tax=Pseudodesulfovibrio alkaliphilus TaxID=2661613 RepID=A0A7K1KJM9_9BACT|nr:ATP-binding cassette domain-containing protein [Pseudodesulfovibrio alkaliphilus]MUM76293.1 ATP-binding cassette domain-containing protein [Pseudodesulfovibrio alkaliphilus]
MRSCDNCLIELRDATVTRGASRLLGPISWQLRRGRHAAVIGDNGSGKTTLLKLLRGELATDQTPGQTQTRTYDFGHGPQSSPIGLRQRIGLVSSDMQDFYFLHARRATARSVILAGLFDTPLLYDEPTEAQRAMAGAVIHELGIGHLAGREMGTLSTGQTRMVLVARALATGPEVLLLDECLEGLDAAAHREVLALIDAASARSTLVCVAHRAGDVPGCVERFTILEGGQVKAEGDRQTALQVLADEPAGLAACDLPTRQSVQPSAAGYPFLVRMDNVSVVVGGTRILHSVHWQVLPGECWAVVGPNGAGKSSLLRLITSELAPYADDAGNGTGTVERLGGMSMDQARSRLGVVSPALQAGYARELGWEVTALETVLSGFRGSVGMLDQPTGNELLAAREWLARVGLAHLAGRSLRRMSYGQQRRVFLARAMAPGPDVLLLDEPLSGLDAPSRALVRRVLDRLAGAGVPFILISHNEADMIGAVNRVLALDAGRVVFSGTREEHERLRGS